jgi:hypothetical protein
MLINQVSADGSFDVAAREFRGPLLFCDDVRERPWPGKPLLIGWPGKAAVLRAGVADRSA